MIEVYDKFIPKSYQRELLKIFKNTAFPWHYQDSILSPNERKNYAVKSNEYNDMPFFHHVVKRGKSESIYFQDIEPLIYFFTDKTGYKVKNIVRIVANLTPPNTKNIRGLPHVDGYSNDAKLKSLLYYVNNSNGETCTFNEKYTGSHPTEVTLYQKIEPEMGKAIVFDSDRYHCNTTSINDCRMVINFILEIE